MAFPPSTTKPFYAEWNLWRASYVDGKGLVVYQYARRIYTVGPEFGAVVKEARDRIRRLPDSARNGRAFGGFWQHMLVAEGAIEAALDWTSKPWDLAPLGIIVEEAGGRSTNVAEERTIYTGNFLSTNGRIHAEVLSLLQ